METTTFIYPIAYIVLLILVAAAGLLFGKQKYNKANPYAMKEERPKKKDTEGRSKQNIRTFMAEKPQDDSLEEDMKVAPDYTQKNTENPVAFADEEKNYNSRSTAFVFEKPQEDPAKETSPVSDPEEEKIAEWKPPSESKNDEGAEYNENEKHESVQVIQEKDDIQERTLNDEWTDDDLEIFEARTYSFDKEENAADDTFEAGTFFTNRDRVPKRDPSEDEGVQVIETNDFKRREELPPVEPPKQSNSKYSYFDSIVEKDLYESAKQEQLRSDDAVVYETNRTKKNPSMQYIELDLNEKE